MDIWTSIQGVIADFTLDKGLRLIGAVVILTIGWQILKTFVKLLKKARFFAALEPTAQNFLRILIEYSLKTILIFTVASILGVPMASLLAILGSVGLAIGLALQGSLTNIAGGFMLFLFKPFKVGDFIIAGGQSGTVSDIGMFYTTLLTADNCRITVPNGALSNQTVNDASVMPNRSVDFKFPVSHGCDIDMIKKTLLDTASSNPMVLKEPAASVFISELTPGAVTYNLRVWCKTSDLGAVGGALLESIKRNFDKNAINWRG